jgi:hypothetical protein
MNEPAVLTASVIAMIGSKLGPSIEARVEKMKIISSETYYQEKFNKLSTLYVQSRLSVDGTRVSEKMAKKDVHQLLKDSCKKLGFEANSSFYKDCLKGGAKLCTALKVDNTPYIKEASTLICKQ